MIDNTLKGLRTAVCKDFPWASDSERSALWKRVRGPVPGLAPIAPMRITSASIPKNYARDRESSFSKPPSPHL